jgi:uncharacterized membrane protein
MTPPFARAFGIGVIAGLRSLTAPAVVSWAAQRREIDLRETRLAFLGAAPAPQLLTALAFAELVGDKLPAAPSRKAPGPFLGRLLLGALSGAALAAAAHPQAGTRPAAAGALLGGLGAVAGTLGGYEARTRLVAALHGPDVAIAVLEDAVAITGGLFLVAGSV